MSKTNKSAYSLVIITVVVVVIIIIIIIIIIMLSRTQMSRPLPISTQPSSSPEMDALC
jgi:uncharacterized membrane protein YqiK